MNYSRFSHASFIIYEQMIAEMVDAYPSCIVITTQDCAQINKSPETVRGRMRDALKAYITNKWPSKINTTKFATIPNPYKELKARLLPDQTILAGKDPAVIRPKPTFSFSSTEPTDHIVKCDSEARQSLVIELCTNNLLSAIRVSGFSVDKITYLEQLHDITFSPTKETGVYLLR